MESSLLSTALIYTNTTGGGYDRLCIGRLVAMKGRPMKVGSLSFFGVSLFLGARSVCLIFMRMTVVFYGHSMGFSEDLGDKRFPVTKVGT